MDINIQWFPGHMAKTKRLLQKNLKLVDLVVEVVDARVPYSSRNPMLAEIIGQKPVLLVLNKADLADPGLTLKWEEYFRKSGLEALPVDSIKGAGVQRVIRMIKQLAGSKTVSIGSARRLPRPPRCMVAGIPNTGKSFLINRMAGRSSAKTANRPGVTRGEQWIRVSGEIDLLDTPGVLWPRFDDQEAGYRLAVTGAIKAEVLDLEAVAGKLAEWLAAAYPDRLAERYSIDLSVLSGAEALLSRVGESRGLVQAGGKVDTYKAAVILLKEFREGLLGRYTLDIPQ